MMHLKVSLIDFHHSMSNKRMHHWFFSELLQISSKICFLSLEQSLYRLPDRGFGATSSRRQEEMLLPAMAPQDQTWAPSLFKKSL
jgi:hypothetical protein